MHRNFDAYEINLIRTKCTHKSEAYDTNLNYFRLNLKKF